MFAQGRGGIAVPFADRAEAGRTLGEYVARCEDLDRPAVVALPRGGVPVGAGVARRLGAPLMVMPVGKVGAPGQEELAVGAVAPGGVQVLNEEVVSTLRLSSEVIEKLVAKAAAKVADQLLSYHGDDGIDLAGRSAVVVDDGLATGATMWAALIAVRRLGPTKVVLAVPVAPPAVLESLAYLVDEEVCPLRPPHMFAVGAWYRDFAQTTDAQVLDLLAELGPERSPPA
ncbi:MAG TPA: phosphoribosyltransferase family protein [Acidimicrobiales bacterium]|nr:phosphoribosyltransferase family protein [Acidimicrobiales bacterium]